jgi:hypothetical protein
VQRPGQAQRKQGVRSAPPGYNNSVFTNAEEGQAERSSQAERSREGGIGGLPRIRHNTARPRSEENMGLGQGLALRRRGDRGSPPTTAIQLTPKKAKRSG